MKKKRRLEKKKKKNSTLATDVVYRKEIAYKSYK
ncbi:hypothetical protein QG37_05352 [Candidozyma auris]|uniref:Uncharacterized protein n=1 Tax=Candidozyma auris TaxID=498019 RepID=A0A0L0NUL0_CANAR|nr:hypothetical protein QG37_05352 [[Candida] auris]